MRLTLVALCLFAGAANAAPTNTLSTPIAVEAPSYLLRGYSVPVAVRGVAPLSNVAIVGAETFAAQTCAGSDCLVPAFTAATAVADVRGEAVVSIFVPRSAGDTVFLQAVTGTGTQVAEVSRIGTLPVLEPTGDADGDGFDNLAEAQGGTDPFVRDVRAAEADGDGVFDALEVWVHGTDPTRADTDRDGVSDGDELRVHGTDPNARDTDADGLTDAEEILGFGTDPTRRDTDGDLLSDYDEVFRHQTSPFSPDTDGDGVLDGVEVHQQGTNPNVP
jgi:hypothetical protein